MNTQEILSAIAGILFVLGFVPYILAVLRDRNIPLGTPGKAEPKKASWLIWASLDVIIIAGMYAKHSVNGLIVGAAVGAWFVVILALKYGAPGWTWLDKFCIAGAILGVALWSVFNDPVLAIATSLGVVFLGSVPTFASAFNDPTKEDKLGWTIFWLSCACAVLAIPKMTFEDAAQPIVFFSIETIMMYLLFIKPRIRFL